MTWPSAALLVASRNPAATVGAALRYRSRADRWIAPWCGTKEQRRIARIDTNVTIRFDSGRLHGTWRVSLPDPLLPRIQREGSERRGAYAATSPGASRHQG